MENQCERIKFCCSCNNSEEHRILLSRRKDEDTFLTSFFEDNQLNITLCIPKHLKEDSPAPLFYLIQKRLDEAFAVLPCLKVQLKEECTMTDD